MTDRTLKSVSATVPRVSETHPARFDSSSTVLIPFVPRPRRDRSTLQESVADATPAAPRVESDSGPVDWADFEALAPFLAERSVTDVFVNGWSGLWVDDGRGLRQITEWHSNERTLRNLAVRLISLGGRHIDEATPCVDVRLHDGIRVHAVLPPVSPNGTLLSIRVPRSARFCLDDLEASGMLSDAHRRLVDSAIARRTNILITGAGGSGKTTLLSAILAGAPKTERIVAIEDVAELRVAHPHFVSLESRQANLEGAGEIGMDRLLREALRMRPDRLVLGECRGGEIREMLAALNTGHDGGAGTLHANSLFDVPARLEALGALAGMSSFAIARQAVSAIGLILHLEHRNGVRRLAEVGRLVLGSNDRLSVTAVVP